MVQHISLPSHDITTIGLHTTDLQVIVVELHTSNADAFCHNCSWVLRVTLHSLHLWASLIQHAACRGHCCRDTGLKCGCHPMHSIRGEVPKQCYNIIGQSSTMSSCLPVSNKYMHMHQVCTWHGSSGTLTQYKVLTLTTCKGSKTVSTKLLFGASLQCNATVPTSISARCW